jgi:hypothetical protein
MDKPIEEELHRDEESDLLMDFKLRYMDAFKHWQRQGNPSQGMATE